MSIVPPPLPPRLARVSELLHARPRYRHHVRGGAPSPHVEAAVLVPLHVLEPEGPLYLWLLKRPESMRTHAGQIAFPGGRRDPEDIDTQATALREAHEEIGLAPERVTPLGPFDDLVTPSGFVIRPLVGLVDPTFSPIPNPSEVELVFRTPLARFTDDPIGEFPRIGYEIEAQFVWGATFFIARMLAQLLQKQPARDRLL